MGSVCRAESTFVNDGQGHFRDISSANDAFCAVPRVARGLVYGDLDNDGGMDLVVSNVAGAAHIYHNVVPQRGRWLLARAVDPELGGRDAYGAVITILAGGHRQTRWSNPGSSYASSNDPRVHFGLGTIARVESIEVLWPDGKMESFDGGAVDRLVVFRKGTGEMRSR